MPPARTASSLSGDGIVRPALADALAVPALGRSLTSTEIFSALAYAPDGAIARELAAHFEVVAAPNAILTAELRPGDVLLRAGGGHGQASILASADLCEAGAIVARGGRPEDRQTGYYAEVIEGGGRPHSYEDHFARRIIDESGRVPANQLILRPRGATGVDAGVSLRSIAGPLEADSGEPQPADAFVLDKSGSRYFNTFPRLGALAIQGVNILSPPLFENLIDQMLASAHKSFVVDAHGTSLGLSMKLAAGSSVSAGKKVLFMLWALERIRFLVSTAEKESIWERASGAPDLERWQQILEIVHSESWHHMIEDPWPTVVPRAASVDEARTILASRSDTLIEALFPGKVSDKAARVARLIGKMQSLQAKGIREVQFRACKMGKCPEALGMFRTFLGADLVCAPDVRNGMAVAAANIGRARVDLVLRNPLAQSYQLPSGRFVIVADIDKEELKVTCAADSQQAMIEWVGEHLMADSGYREGALPVHLLELTPRTFPLDDAYARHIKCRSSFWEAAIRASHPDVAPAAPAPARPESEDDPTPARSAASARVVDPFPGPDPAALTAADAALARCVNAVSANPRVRDLCSGLVDLTGVAVTGAPGPLPYIGHNDTDMLYVGSVAKIYPLLAAFALRERVSMQAQAMIDGGLSTSKSGWQQHVFDALRRGWQPLLDARFPKHPKGRHPDFNSILTIGADGSARFLGCFLGWIKDATKQNDEEAAGQYIRALSYPYINGALAAAGFFDATTQTGLWISGDYNGNDWMPQDGAALPLTARWRAPHHAVSNFVGTARQISRFIGLMAIGRLVMSASAADMIDLLGTPWLRDNLANAHPPRAFTSLAGKVGIGEWGDLTHDTAILSWAHDPDDAAKTIRYALVVLGSDRSTAQLTQLELGFHDCIVSAHPEAQRR